MVPLSCDIVNHQKQRKYKQEESCQDLHVCWCIGQTCPKHVDMILDVFLLSTVYTHLIYGFIMFVVFYHNRWMMKTVTRGNMNPLTIRTNDIDSTKNEAIAITDSTKHKIIDEYKKHPCLWDPSIDDYQDRSSILNAKIKIGK